MTDQLTQVLGKTTKRTDLEHGCLQNKTSLIEESGSMIMQKAKEFTCNQTVSLLVGKTEMYTTDTGKTSKSTEKGLANLQMVLDIKDNFMRESLMEKDFILGRTEVLTKEISTIERNKV